MVDWGASISALGVAVAIGIAAWLYSVVRRDVSIVDGLWSLMILASLAAYIGFSGSWTARGALLLVLVAVWAIRLSVHITVRNHGKPEDRRYQAIRANNGPNFWFKSLYIVFGLQAVLAWFIAMPAIVASGSAVPLGWMDLAAVMAWSLGMYFEVVGDWQLLRFRRDRDTDNAVLDLGLWRYTRHPNYFGEALVWWGVYLAALPAGAWWTLLSPLLMTILLLRVSGVALLERDIAERRPAYREYIQRTSAFVPAPPRRVPRRGATNGA